MRRPMSDRHAVVILVCISLIHLAIYFIANTPRPIFTEDLPLISGFLKNFTADLHAGVWRPQWAGQMFSGLGAPVFLYYSPAAYYVSSLFALPSTLDPLGIYQLGLAMTAALATSALGSYAWLRRHAEVNVALSVAATLLVLPSQFAAMHINISLAQLWAAAIFPIALICIERWRETQETKALLKLALALAAILLTHLPSALLFWPVLLLYGASYPEFRSKSLIPLLFAITLAFGLASFWWLPAFANRQFIQLDRYTHFISDYSILFAPPYALLLNFLPQPFVNISPYLLLALAAVPSLRRERLAQIACCAIAAVSILCLPLSIPLWQHCALLQMLPTPFRLLTLCFALSPSLLLLLRSRLNLTVYAAILALFILPDFWITAEEYMMRYENALSPSGGTISALNFRTQSITREYRTAWMSAQASPAHFEAYAALPQASGNAKVEVIDWRDDRITLSIHADAPTEILLKRHFFPAWQAGEPFSLRPNGDGLMLLSCTAGDHTITITFHPAGTMAGSCLSLFSFALLTALWTRGVFSRTLISRKDMA